MKAEVSRSEEISPIILLIIISIVRPFVPDSLVLGVGHRATSSIGLRYSTTRLDYDSPRHITLVVNLIFRDSWHSSVAMGLPRAGSFVLGIGSELPAVTPNGRMVAHGPPDAADVDCRCNCRGGFSCVSSALV